MFALLLASVIRFVDPFVGTTFTGHTFPGACVPFGLVQASPDTGTGDWHHCAGYRFEEKTLCGFSQTHLNGTGCADLGDVLLLPFTGERPPEFYELDKGSEKASPGYYAVSFDRGNFAAEVSATEHCAIYRFTYLGRGPAKLLYDGQWLLHSWGELSNVVQRAAVELDADRRGFAGTRATKAWVERELGFAVRFDRPFAAAEKLRRRPSDRADSCVFTFDMEVGETLTVKVGLSARGESAAARGNLDAEIPDFDFPRVRSAAERKWEGMLSRIEIEGTDDQKRNFYTSLYHLFIQPNNIADAGEKPFYSTFSCWDTFRAAHPLYTIVCPEFVPDMVDSMLEQGRRSGYLPIWTLWGKDNQCMIGTHSVPVIVDAYLKGLWPRSPSCAERPREATSPSCAERPREATSPSCAERPREAFAQIKETLTAPHSARKRENWDLLDRYGYYPCDLVNGNSVSSTLECCYDDHCAALMAERLGLKGDAEFFRKRSKNWRHLFNPESRLACPKLASGKWKAPFDPYELRYGNDYTEGNAFQYTWQVMQDPQGLIEALGGREAALGRLDELFTLKKADGGEKVLDVTGSIGQYVHGNEPSHHIIYFYTLLGERGKTAAMVEEVFKRFYLPKPDGLCGNDDCGQMSAWYIFSAAGFYPFDPCGGEYVLGHPQLPKVVFHLRNGKTFTVVRSRESGSRLPTAISHDTIMRGAELAIGR